MVDRNYFRLPPIPLTAAVLIGVGLLHCLAFVPELFPYKALLFFGPHLKTLGSDYSTALQYLCLAVWVAHLFEAAMAFSTARRLGLTTGALWAVQTFIVCALRLLFTNSFVDWIPVPEHPQSICQSCAKADLN